MQMSVSIPLKYIVQNMCLLLYVHKCLTGDIDYPTWTEPPVTTLQPPVTVQPQRTTKPGEPVVDRSSKVRYRTRNIG